MTLVPAMAETAGHVTMLQRSPSYIISLPTKDPIDARLRTLVGTRRAYPLIRWKNVLVSTLIYQLSQRRPQMMRNWIRGMTIKQLPAGYQVDTHFKPVYNPWDQRLCLVPDGDLFRAIRNQRASVVTGGVATFTEDGLRLESGEELEADIVVTATGLQLLALGGIELTVGGRAIRLPDTMAYKGMMLSGVPNFAFTIGYTNASWTLKATWSASTSAGCSGTWIPMATTCASRSTRIRASPSSRCSTSRRDTCSAPSISSRGPARGPPGGSA